MDNQLQESTRSADFMEIDDQTRKQASQLTMGLPSGNRETTAIFQDDEAQSLRTRWQKIQTEFVDEPRKSVEQADELVVTITQRLNEVFREQRDKMEHEWDKGDVSTEDLRTAFRRYRTLFDRLLSI